MIFWGSMRSVLLLAVALAAAQPVAAAEAPLLFLGADLDPTAAEALRREAAVRGIDLANPALGDDASAETVLAEVRPLYRDMAFGRAVRRLAAAEAALIVERLPTERTRGALAEVEVWLGACLLLDGKVADAQEHLALARRLARSIDADPIFPPEVRNALQQAAHVVARPLPLMVKLAPADARLWIDGELVGDAPSVTPGLHYVVVERADKRRYAAVLRLPHAAPEIAVSLGEAVAPEQALRQAAARLRQGVLGADEAVAVSRLLARPIWVASSGSIDRFLAGDAARPVAHAESPDGAGPLLDAACRLDRGCAPPAALVAAAPTPTVVVKRPWYRRAAFWIPVSAAVVVVVGASVLAVTLSQRSTDYVVRIR
jgi:hypothetical protein